MEDRESKMEKRQKRVNLNQIYSSFAEHGRVPPQAVDIEEAVLGAMMLEDVSLKEVISVLKEDVFYKESNQLIFKAIYSLFVKSEVVDILTVTNKLKSTGELELVGGAYHITQLTNRVASTANMLFHAKIINYKYKLREIIRTSSDAIKEAYEDTSDLEEIKYKLLKDIYALDFDNFTTNTNIEFQVDEVIKNIAGINSGEHTESYLPTGYPDLDRLIVGLTPGDLIIIGARPGMGKTAFMLSLIDRMAFNFGIPCAIFSLEMSYSQIVSRLISIETAIPMIRMRKQRGAGGLEELELARVKEASKKIKESRKIFIDDTPSINYLQLKLKIIRIIATFGIKIVFIDYLQLMSFVKSREDVSYNREQVISDISRNLKIIAKELNIPIVVASQLSRQLETRSKSNKRPQLNDLRESGAIEQDADLVIFLYRHSVYGKEKENIPGITGTNTGSAVHPEFGLQEGESEVIIEKFRNGPTGTVPMRFISVAMRFDDYNNDDKPPQKVFQSNMFENNQEPDLPF